MRSAALPAVAACLLAWAGPALAFKRATSETSGSPLWWSTRTVPYVVNGADANLDGCVPGGRLLEEVRAGFAAWPVATRPGESQACTDFTFRFDGTSETRALRIDDRQNVLVVRRGSCSRVARGDPCLSSSDPDACVQSFNCWDHEENSLTIALTFTAYNPATGQIVDADVELNGRSSVDDVGSYWFTCPETDAVCSVSGRPNGSCVSMDLRSTVTHEAGHALGLAHNCGDAPRDCSSADDPAATMYATASIGDLAKRTLHADDVAGICSIYPRGGQTSTVPLRPSSSSSGGGCSTGGDLGAAAVAAVVALVSRRRKSRQDPELHSR